MKKIVNAEGFEDIGSGGDVRDILLTDNLSDAYFDSALSTFDLVLPSEGYTKGDTAISTTTDMRGNDLKSLYSFPIELTDNHGFSVSFRGKTGLSQRPTTKLSIYPSIIDVGGYFFTFGYIDVQNTDMTITSKFGIIGGSDINNLTDYYGNKVGGTVINDDATNIYYYVVYDKNRDRYLIVSGDKVSVLRKDMDAEVLDITLSVGGTEISSVVYKAFLFGDLLYVTYRFNLTVVTNIVSGEEVNAFPMQVDCDAVTNIAYTKLPKSVNIYKHNDIDGDPDTMIALNGTTSNKTTYILINHYGLEDVKIYPTHDRLDIQRISNNREIVITQSHFSYKKGTGLQYHNDHSLFFMRDLVTDKLTFLGDDKELRTLFTSGHGGHDIFKMVLTQNDNVYLIGNRGLHNIDLRIGESFEIENGGFLEKENYPNAHDLPCNIVVGGLSRLLQVFNTDNNTWICIYGKSSTTTNTSIDNDLYLYRVDNTDDSVNRFAGSTRGWYPSYRDPITNDLYLFRRSTSEISVYKGGDHNKSSLYKLQASANTMFGYSLETNNGGYEQYVFYYLESTRYVKIGDHLYIHGISQISDLNLVDMTYVVHKYDSSYYDRVLSFYHDKKRNSLVIVGNGGAIEFDLITSMYDYDYMNRICETSTALKQTYLAYTRGNSRILHDTDIDVDTVFTYDYMVYNNNITNESLLYLLDRGIIDDSLMRTRKYMDFDLSDKHIDVYRKTHLSSSFINGMVYYFRTNLFINNGVFYYPTRNSNTAKFHNGVTSKITDFEMSGGYSNANETGIYAYYNNCIYNVALKNNEWSTFKVTNETTIPVYLAIQRAMSDNMFLMVYKNTLGSTASTNAQDFTYLHKDIDSNIYKTTSAVTRNQNSKLNGLVGVTSNSNNVLGTICYSNANEAINHVNRGKVYATYVSPTITNVNHYSKTLIGELPINKWASFRMDVKPDNSNYKQMLVDLVINEQLVMGDQPLTHTKSTYPYPIRYSSPSYSNNIIPTIATSLASINSVIKQKGNLLITLGEKTGNLSFGKEYYDVNSSRVTSINPSTITDDGILVHYSITHKQLEFYDYKSGLTKKIIKQSDIHDPTKGVNVNYRVTSYNNDVFVFATYDGSSNIVVYKIDNEYNISVFYEIILSQTLWVNGYNTSVKISKIDGEYAIILDRSNVSDNNINQIVIVYKGEQKAFSFNVLPSFIRQNYATHATRTSTFSEDGILVYGINDNGKTAIFKASIDKNTVLDDLEFEEHITTDLEISISNIFEISDNRTVICGTNTGSFYIHKDGNIEHIVLDEITHTAIDNSNYMVYCVDDSFFTIVSHGTPREIELIKYDINEKSTEVLLRNGTAFPFGFLYMGVGFLSAIDDIVVNQFSATDDRGIGTVTIKSGNAKYESDWEFSGETLSEAAGTTPLSQSKSYVKTNVDGNLTVDGFNSGKSLGKLVGIKNDFNIDKNFPLAQSVKTKTRHKDTVLEESESHVRIIGKNYNISTIIEHETLNSKTAETDFTVTVETDYVKEEKQ